MVNIEINGVKLEVKQGSMIIEAADEAGIKVPRFCYHKKLSIAANCRMCLVEVGGGRKPVPACATPVTEGMKVYTQSQIALDAQRAVMEFLLINHPLDCPICDQGGECELQDVSVGFGGDISQYTEGKRVVKDKNLGPLIATDMTRCIHCTRCVRFGKEIAGVREMGATGRGEHTEIGTYIERSVDSELSGNIIDVCPVGALTSKPFRFKSRTWELKQYPSVAPHDCLGSNVHVHTKHNKIYRVVPRENESVNEVWLSDRDRFSYEAIESPARLQKPMIKEGGVWKETDWQTALDFVATQMKRVMAYDGADKVGGLISPSATLEEGYLLQQFIRGMGSHHIDHRIGQTDFSDQHNAPLFPRLAMNVVDIEHLDVAFLIGSNIRKEQPLLGHRLFKATQNNAKVVAVNPVAYEFVFPLQAEVVSPAGGMLYDLAIIAKLLEIKAEHIKPHLDNFKMQATNAHQGIVDALKQGQHKALFLGQAVHYHPQAAQIRLLAHAIAEAVGASVNELTEGANAAGLWLAGCVPHRTPVGTPLSYPGFDVQEMLEKRLNAYFLLGVEPEYDFAHSAEVIATLNAANLVVMMTPFMTQSMKSYAHVLLPMSTFTETSGTYVNLMGQWQSFEGVKMPVGDARPGWKIIRVLGNLLGIPGFNHNSSVEVRDELLKKYEAAHSAFAAADMPIGLSLDIDPVLAKQLIRVAEKPIYALDSLVRRASSLQKTKDAIQAAACLNPKEAARLGFAAGSRVRVKQGQYSITLPLQTDIRVPDRSVLLPMGLDETVGLGRAYSAIEIEQA